MGAPLDLAASDVNQDPAGFTASALADGAVQWSEANRGWLLLSHEVVSAGFRDVRLSADRVEPLQRLADERPADFAKAVELLSGWMIFRDPPAHTHLRDPVRRAFTPKVVDGLRPTIESTTAQLIEDLPTGDRFDFRTEFAEPLPALVIAALLGVPGSERQRFKTWSDGLAEIVFSVAPGSVTSGVGAAVDDFTNFFTDLIDHRRRNPGEDLISQMVAGGADTLTAMELVGACTLLLFAGHETTTNMLASSIKVLAKHPEQRHLLVEDHSIETTAANELLRVAGPAKSMVRRVGPERFDYAGASFEPRQKVFLVILSANHDPSVFDHPARLDLRRDPNPHLGFGWGLHHCLGAPLARMELAVALRALYQTMPDLAPVDPDAPWGGNELGRGIGSMVVAGR